MKAPFVFAAALLAVASSAYAADEDARKAISGATVSKCPLGTVPVYYGPHPKDYRCVRKQEPDQRTAAGQGSDGPPTDADATGTARGIEKKDIRRGMVIAKPGSIKPHARTGAPGGGEPIEDHSQGSPQPSQVTIKEKSSNVKNPVGVKQ